MQPRSHQDASEERTLNPNIDYDNCPTCCANRREDRRIVDESDGGDTYCSDPWHTRPTPSRDGGAAKGNNEGGGRG